MAASVPKGVFFSIPPCHRGRVHICMKEATGLRRWWHERVLVIHSPTHAQKQTQGLEKRLSHAEEKLYALTPDRGRGKRQLTTESDLLEAIGNALKSHRVEGLLRVEYVKQTDPQTKYVGRGRGSAQREQQVIEKVRYQITKVRRNDEQIAHLQAGLGWKAFVTNATAKRLPLEYDGKVTRRMIGQKAEIYDSPDDMGNNQEFYVRMVFARDPAVQFVVANSDNVDIEPGVRLNGVFVYRNGVRMP